MSLNDSLAVSASYSINWSTNESALPASHISFEDKFVNISKIAGTVSIDNVVWHWTDAEASSYTESQLYLYKYNTTNNWTLMNSSPDTGANTLSLSSFDPTSTYGILQGTANCPVISSSGTFNQVH